MSTFPINAPRFVGWIASFTWLQVTGNSYFFIPCDYLEHQKLEVHMSLQRLVGFRPLFSIIYRLQMGDRTPKCNSSYPNVIQLYRVHSRICNMPVFVTCAYNSNIRPISTTDNGNAVKRNNCYDNTYQFADAYCVSIYYKQFFRMKCCCFKQKA